MFTGKDKSGATITRDFLLLRDGEQVREGIQRLAALDAGWDIPTDLNELTIVDKMVMRKGSEFEMAQMYDEEE
jgi:hypothetical protein